MRSKTISKVGIPILVILAVGGIWAIAQRMIHGMETTQLTSSMAWGMWVAFYIYCIGLSAGSFLMSTMVYVFGMDQFEKMGRMALLSALFALFGGMAFIWIDLGHPWRFWRVFANWHVTSVLAWESLLYLFYIVAICGELWLLMRCDLDRLARQHSGLRGRFYRLISLGWHCPSTPEGQKACHAQSMRWVRIIGIIGVPIAIGVHGGTGALFAVVAAKPYWFSGLFPIIFLVSALVSGCGLMLFLYAFWGRRDADYLNVIDSLRGFMILFIAVDVILFISDTLVGLYGRIPDHVNVLRAIMFGDYWYVFWIGQIAMAWILPLILGSLPATRRNPIWLGISGFSVVVGIIAVRLNLVIPAYLEPPFKGMAEAAQDARLAYHYFPSFIEFMSSIGLFAMLALGLIIFWRLLPLYEVEEHAESHAD